MFAGEEKAKFPFHKMLILCVVAGCYVGLGYTFLLMVRRLVWCTA